jgi:O-antigen/teichoic acid export membrane protein
MVVGGVASIFIFPAFSAIYPRFSALASTGNEEHLIRLYRFGTRLLGSTLFPVAFTVVFFANDLLFVWTGNLELAKNTAQLLKPLIIATSIHGVMHFPYALQLAYGMAGLCFRIALILLIIMVPLIVLLTLNYGALGGAFAWLILNLIYLPMGAWLTHRQLLKGLALKWLFKDVCLPFVFSALLVGSGELLLAAQNWGHYIRLLCAGGFAVSAMLILISVSPQLRTWILDNYHQKL